MTNRPPADIGMELTDIDTPALIIDLDTFEANLDRMAQNARNLGVRLRPHAKMHKSADISRAQISRGAVGVCCQKVSEAETLIDSGVNNILITNEVVGQRKLDRFSQLSMRADISICVDNSQNIEDLNTSAAKFGTRLDTLVEVNVGGDRCGVLPGAPVLKLAKQIGSTTHLNFCGLHAYEGRVQHIRSFAERKNAIEHVSNDVAATVALLKDNEISCQHITGAGTGTWQFEGSSKVFTELQAGSYAFMDADYARNENADGEFIADFDQSLFVYTTVMSIPNSEFVVVDAGLKCFAFDSGMPVVTDDLTVNYHRPSDEHGVLDLSNSSRRYSLGDKVRLTPGHCDPTVNLHDWYVCVRGDQVEALWEITARGAIF